MAMKPKDMRYIMFTESQKLSFICCFGSIGGFQSGLVFGYVIGLLIKAVM